MMASEEESGGGTYFLLGSYFHEIISPHSIGALLEWSTLRRGY